MLRRSVIVLLLLLAPAVVFAQQNIPAPDEYLGYTIGERLTTYDRILAHSGALAKRSNLITLQQFGSTYEGRPLMLATITSAKNRGDREAIPAHGAVLA